MICGLCGVDLPADIIAYTDGLCLDCSEQFVEELDMAFIEDGVYDCV